jgi:hypothetical protein
VVFDQNAIHIHASHADGHMNVPVGIRRGDGNLKGARCRGRRARQADDVERAGMNASREFGQQLIPVRIQMDASLLHDHAEIIIP